MSPSTFFYAFLLSAIALTPSIVKAHGEVAWISVAGQRYDAFTLDDYYTMPWNPSSVHKYSRKQDNLNLGPTSIFDNAIATGGWNTGHQYDDQSPVLPIPAKAGDSVTVQWKSWNVGHPGPIGEMMAKCPGNSCTKVDATQLDWFSIAQHNYDTGAGTWPTEIMRQQNGQQWTFTLPWDLPGGAYLLRHELYSLHEDKGPNGMNSPQHYPTTFELNFESNGNTNPQPTCRFPGCFSYNDYEWHHNIYTSDVTKWEFPGIAVYSGGYTTGVVNGASVGKAPQGSSNKSTSSEPSTTSVEPIPSAESKLSAEPSSSVAPETSRVPSPESTQASSTHSATPSATEPSKKICRIRTSNANGTQPGKRRVLRKKSEANSKKRHARRQSVLRTSIH